MFLVGTPSQGAPLAKVVSHLPPDIRGQLVVNLQSDDMPNFLTGLQRQWHAVLDKRQGEGNPIAFACAYELLPPPVLRKPIVPQASIDGRCNNRYPIPADHLKIVKPTGREDEIYKWLLRQLAAANRPPPQDSKIPKTAVDGSPPVADPPKTSPPPPPVVAGPEPDPPSKEAAEGGKTAMGSRQDKTTVGTPRAASGSKDIAGPAPPSPPAPATSAHTGMAVLRLAGLDRGLDTLVRLNWGRLERKVKLLAKGGDGSAATHELNVTGSKNDKQDPAGCGNWVWKRAWTLEFELAPLTGTVPSRHGKVTEGACHGTKDSEALDSQALKAAVRSMIRELETWRLQ